MLDYAVSEARKEGLQEGEKKGLQKGERNKVLDIAKEMKKEGFTTEQIARVTKLSLKEIKRL